MFTLAFSRGISWLLTFSEFECKIVFFGRSQVARVGFSTVGDPEAAAQAAVKAGPPTG